MAKIKRETCFVCTSCGQSQQKWMGRCPGCNSWNTLVEETRVTGTPTRTHSNARSNSGQTQATRITEVEHENIKRYPIGIDEFDRVLGGGLVPGCVALLSGEPGIGKSTLLLTTAFCLAKRGLKVLYVSAEESISQIRMTAERLSALHDNLYLLAETDLSAALAEVERVKPSVLILDSVQTVYAPELESAPGSVSQIREVTAQIVSRAKSTNMATFLVGHVTKDGNIAGPRLLEHMVDAVLYFESTRTGPYRFLRSHKNRFGSTNEMGVFEMRGDGLGEVTNPSEFFLAERPVGKAGSTVAAAIEGTRSLLVEVQALCVSSLFGNPRRTTLGIDSTRCALLAAVLEKHASLVLSGQDLFVNVAGGTNLVEPAADLPVAIAIASSLTNRPVHPNLVCFGEVGLSGEIRGVHRVEARLAEAKRLGFTLAIIPQVSATQLDKIAGMEIIGVNSLDKAIDAALQEFSRAPKEATAKSKQVQAN
jgi:DNA repair protein RadA/Sms